MKDKDFMEAAAGIRHQHELREAHDRQVLRLFEGIRPQCSEVSDRGSNSCAARTVPETHLRELQIWRASLLQANTTRSNATSVTALLAVRMFAFLAEFALMICVRAWCLFLNSSSNVRCAPTGAIERRKK